MTDSVNSVLVFQGFKALFVEHADTDDDEAQAQEDGGQSVRSEKIQDDGEHGFTFVQAGCCAVLSVEQFAAGQSVVEKRCAGNDAGYAAKDVFTRPVTAQKAVGKFFFPGCFF